MILDCDQDHVPALLRTEYDNRQFNPRPEGPGIFRYKDWLPVIRAPENAGRGTVLGRVAGHGGILTVASSGNTGAAFAWGCSRGRQPCLLIVPQEGLGRLRFRAAMGRLPSHYFQAVGSGTGAIAVLEGRGESALR